MVINDEDGIDPAELPVLRDMGEVAGVRLPHASESVFLKSLPVAHVRVTRRLQVIAADETLDGAHADGRRDVAVPDQLEIDLRGVEPREILPELEDPGNSLIRKDTGGTFVRTCFGHEGINAASVVERHPFFQGLMVVYDNLSVRLGERFLRDPLVVLRPALIRIKILDDRGDEGKAELRDLSCPGDFIVRYFLITHSKNLLTERVLPCEGDHHAHVVWEVAGAKDACQAGNSSSPGLRVTGEMTTGSSGRIRWKKRSTLAGMPDV